MAMSDRYVLFGKRNLVKNLLARFAKDETASTAIEYCLVASLVALVIISSLTKLGKDVSAKFNTIAANLS
jgi:pilus assembly protein Flp/PilA